MIQKCDLPKANCLRTVAMIFTAYDTARDINTKTKGNSWVARKAYTIIHTKKEKTKENNMKYADMYP